MSCDFLPLFRTSPVVIFVQELSPYCPLHRSRLTWPSCFLLVVMNVVVVVVPLSHCFLSVFISVVFRSDGVMTVTFYVC